MIQDDCLINLEQYTSADVGANNVATTKKAEELSSSNFSDDPDSSNYCLPAVCVIPNPMSVLNKPNELTKAIAESLKLNITRDGAARPISEFGNNDKLMYGAFPFIFLLGKGMSGSGSCPVLFRQMILRQYDNRASKNSKFNFIMFNQIQRHAAISTVAARAKSNPKSLLKFMSIVNADGYMDRLKAAVKAPDSNEAKEMVKSLMPLIHVSGKNVPFGASERAKTLSVLNAYTGFFGLPSWFITVSPADIDSPLMIRLGHCHKDNRNSKGLNVKSVDLGVPILEIPIPTNSTLRAIILAQNPGVAAEMFEKIIRAVVKCLLNIPLTEDYKKTRPSYDVTMGGVLGTLYALVMIFECQGRGSLHAHAAGWGSLVPRLLEIASNSKTFANIIANSINTMVLAQLPQCVHDTRNDKLVDKTTRFGLNMISPFQQFSPQSNTFEDIVDQDQELKYKLTNEPKSHDGVISSFLPKSLDAMTELDKRVYMCALKVNVHTCGFSCAKGKSGLRGCRFGFPAPGSIVKTGPCILSLEGVTSEGNECCFYMASLHSLNMLFFTEKKVLPVSVSYDIGPLQCHLPVFTELNSGKDKYLQFVKLLMKTDNRNLLWQLERPDLIDVNDGKELSHEFKNANSHVTPYNYAVGACLSCNQAMIFLGNAEQCKSIIFYMIKYMVKDSTVLQNAAALLVHAFKHVHKFKSVAEDAGTPTRDAAYLVQRVVNSISGKIEVSDSLACASNLGLKSSIASHGTWLVYIGPAVSFVKRHLSCAVFEKSSNDDEIPIFASDSSGDDESDEESLYWKEEENSNSVNLVCLKNIV